MSASLAKINHYPFSFVISAVSFKCSEIFRLEVFNGVGVCDGTEDVVEVELELATLLIIFS